MGFPTHIDTLSIGLRFVYFKGSQVELSIFYNVFLSLKVVLANIMLHFFWVFTVCHSTCLVVSSIQGVNG